MKLVSEYKNITMQLINLRREGGWTFHLRIGHMVFLFIFFCGLKNNNNNNI